MTQLLAGGPVYHGPHKYLILIIVLVVVVAGLGYLYLRGRSK